MIYARYDGAVPVPRPQGNSIFITRGMIRRQRQAICLRRRHCSPGDPGALAALDAMVLYLKYLHGRLRA